MLLLRFRTQNHRSLRDPAELSLVQGRLKTNRPTDGRWSDFACRTVALYGPNASGKSTVINAIKFMRNVISNSATTWADRDSLPHRPFRLDDHSSSEPSEYAIDFVLENDIRYEYGFSMNSERILEEWLYDYPVGRQRLLFERRGSDEYRFGRALTGGTAILEKLTGERELLLSRAAITKNEFLRKIHSALTNQIQIAEFSDSDRQKRLETITKGLVEKRIELSDIVTLLKVADVGISEISVEKSEMPAEFRSMLERIFEAANSEGEEAVGSDGDGTEVESHRSRKPRASFSFEEVSHALAFEHAGEGGQTYRLSATVQSTGTMSWLGLALPSLEILRTGGVLLIDELDASLHPQLAQTLIGMFKESAYNKRGAQLVFTTHDTYFISPASPASLDPEEVWFAEKGRDGATEIYSLGDYPVRKDDNLSRRYLHGRYGAVPSLAPSFIAGLMEEAPNSDGAYEGGVKR